MSERNLDNERLCKRVASVDNQVANDALAELLRLNRGIIVKWVMRYSEHAPFDDLYAEACKLTYEYCLKRETVRRKFKHSSFITGLVWEFRANLGRYARNYGYRTIRISENAYFGKYKKDFANLPRVAFSLDAPREQNSAVLDYLRLEAHKQHEHIEKTVHRRLIHRELKSLVEGLPEPLMSIVNLYYWKGYTFADIAGEYHKSREWARNVHDEAISRLKVKAAYRLAGMMEV